MCGDLITRGDVVPTSSCQGALPEDKVLPLLDACEDSVATKEVRLITYTTSHHIFHSSAHPHSCPGLRTIVRNHRDPQIHVSRVGGVWLDIQSLRAPVG